MVFLGFYKTHISKSIFIELLSAKKALKLEKFSEDENLINDSILK
jgi:hypothetical protein